MLRARAPGNGDLSFALCLDSRRPGPGSSGIPLSGNGRAGVVTVAAGCCSDCPALRRSESRLRVWILVDHDSAVRGIHAR